MKREFKTYQLLDKISINLRKIEDDTSVIKELNLYVKELKASLSDDFFQLFNQEIEIDNTTIYYNDSSYRQSTTGFVFNVFFKEKKDINLKVDCLIDQNRIFLNVLNDSKRNYIIYCIKKAYNTEEVSELKKINVSFLQKITYHFSNL